VLEAGGHERADRRHDREDPIGGRSRAVGEPDREAHQCVAEHAENDGLDEAGLELGVGDRERGDAEGAVAPAMGARQGHRKRGGGRADEVAREDDEPVPQQGRGADPASGPRHHDEVVAGEELRPADHDEDEPEAEDHAREDPDRSPGSRARAGQRGGGEHAAERDERPGEDREREQVWQLEAGLADPDLLRALRHLGREQGVQTDRGALAAGPGLRCAHGPADPAGLVAIAAARRTISPRARRRAGRSR
jgi:hypothetical protein